MQGSVATDTRRGGSFNSSFPAVPFFKFSSEKNYENWSRSAQVIIKIKDMVYVSNYPFVDGFLEVQKVNGFVTTASKFAGGGV